MTGAELRERLAKQWDEYRLSAEYVRGNERTDAAWWLSAIVAELGITREMVRRTMDGDTWDAERALAAILDLAGR